MFQTQAVDRSYFKELDGFRFDPCKTLETFQIHKIGAVALACLSFFTFQMNCTYPMVAAITLLGSSLTWLSETFLRTQSKENVRWFNSDFDPFSLIIQVAIRLLVLPVVVCLMTLSGVAPIQAVALKIMAGNLRVIFIATVLAPLAEEIIFRGFIQERFEDAMALFNQYIYPVSERVQQGVSTYLQALFFGAIHITGNQVANFGGKLMVMFSTSLLGFWLTLQKKRDQSLLTPIAIHSAQNTGLSIGLLGSRCFS